jgi:hypothetical protein
VEIFDKINGLEPLKVNVLIDGLVLNCLLVLVKLLVPFLLIFGIGLRVRTPIRHTQPRVSQPGIPSDDHHAQDTGGSHEQPTAHEFLLTRLDELLRISVLSETLLKEGRCGLYEWGQRFSDYHLFVMFLILLLATLIL